MEKSKTKQNKNQMEMNNKVRNTHKKLQNILRKKQKRRGTIEKAVQGNGMETRRKEKAA